MTDPYIENPTYGSVYLQDGHIPRHFGSAGQIMTRAEWIEFKARVEHFFSENSDLDILEVNHQLEKRFPEYFDDPTEAMR